MSFTVSLDQQQLSAVNDVLGYIKNGVPRATMRAANVGAARAKAESGRKLKALLTAPARRITDSLKVSKRATLSDPTSVFTGEGKPIELVYFSHNGTLTKSDGGGIIADIFKMGGNPLRLKHGFMARMKSGHIGIFTRKSPKTGKVSPRLPIYESYGPNAAEALEKTPEALRQVMEFAMDKYMFELDRQVIHLFKQEYGVEPPEDWL